MINSLLCDISPLYELVIQDKNVKIEFPNKHIHPDYEGFWKKGTTDMFLHENWLSKDTDSAFQKELRNMISQTNYEINECNKQAETANDI